MQAYLRLLQGALSLMLGEPPTGTFAISHSYALAHQTGHGVKSAVDAAFSNGANCHGDRTGPNLNLVANTDHADRGGNPIAPVKESRNEDTVYAGCRIRRLPAPSF